MREFADSWALLAMTLFFIGVALFAFRAGQPQGRRRSRRDPSPGRSSHERQAHRRRVRRRRPPATSGMASRDSTTRCRAGGCGPSTPRSSGRWPTPSPSPPGRCCVRRPRACSAIRAAATSRSELARRKPPRAATSRRSRSKSVDRDSGRSDAARLRRRSRRVRRSRSTASSATAPAPKDRRASRTSTTTTGCGAAAPTRSTLTDRARRTLRRRPETRALRDAALRRRAASPPRSTRSRAYVAVAVGRPGGSGARRRPAGRSSPTTARPATAMPARATASWVRRI